MEESKFCKECGVEYKNTDKFCNNCGIDLFKINSEQLFEESVEPPSQSYDYILASRTKRLLARLVDGLLGVLAVVIVGTIIAITVGGGKAIIGAVVAGLSFMIYQYYLLATISQTLGKRFMNIIIIDKDGNPCGFLTNVILREWIIGLIGLFPVVGVIIRLVDILFIFRTDRRCIHDMIAGTKVILIQDK